MASNDMEKEGKRKERLERIGREAFEMIDKLYEKQYKPVRKRLVNAAESGDVDYLNGAIKNVPPQVFLPKTYLRPVKNVPPLIDSFEASSRYGLDFIDYKKKTSRPQVEASYQKQNDAEEITTPKPVTDQKQNDAEEITTPKPATDQKQNEAEEQTTQKPVTDQKQNEADEKTTQKPVTDQKQNEAEEKTTQKPVSDQKDKVEAGLQGMAERGDVGDLRKALGSQVPPIRFLPMTDIPFEKNIIHWAVIGGHKEFIRVALEALPNKIALILCIRDPTSLNPLHLAASRGDCDILDLLVTCYKSRLDEARGEAHDEDNFLDLVPRCPPWLGKDHEFERTPLLMALLNKHERAAMSLLMLYTELVCNMCDKFGCSPLYAAVRGGLSRIAVTILTSRYSYSLSGPEGSTPLHVVPNCCENVCRLLLQKHPDLINAVDEKGYNVLHKWAEIGKEWPLHWLLNNEFFSARNSAFTNLIYSKDTTLAQNPLHIAAWYGYTEILRLLVTGYQQEMKVQGSTSSMQLQSNPPWKMKDAQGNTPLHTALSHNRDKAALYLLSLDPGLCHIRNNEGESPIFVAVKNGCEEGAKQILSCQDLGFSMLRRNDGQTILHILSKSTEEVTTLVTEKYWWLIHLTDNNGRTAVDEAKASGLKWLIDKLTELSLTKGWHFDWSKICESGDLSVLRTLIDRCQDFKKLCLQQKNTPLHHIKLQTYRDYKDFLAIPLIEELKNTRDSEGATPLHRALQRQDMFLTELLLTDAGVDRYVKDKSGRSAMDLLHVLCDENEEWDEMCKLIGVNPRLKTTYIQPRTNLADMRGTLSVVAALLATITFAAGFTLPGGFTNDKGDALLAKNAAFLVFLLADSYAMCCSMLVLFCLIWSMVCDPDKSMLLIDRSVVILMQSLYGSLVAFMTGVYTVVSHKSLWAAIIILFMCSVVGISTNRTILYRVVDKFIPAANREQHKDRVRSLEEGR